MRRVVPVMAMLLVATASADGQVVSRTGSFLDPWGAIDFDPSDMTGDGQWVVFVESVGTGCDGTTLQRISTARSDGTGYRIVVDESVVESLEPDVETLIDSVIVSGNGQWAVFSWPHKESQCAVTGPFHWYLVDIATGDVSEITFNGEVVGQVSLTSDGSTMVFFGYDPLADGWYTYVAGISADPDRGGAEKLRLPALSFMQPGKISGNGEKYVFAGNAIGTCCPAELYVHDIGSGVTTVVTPQPVSSGIVLFDISDDGNRISYGGANSFWGVESDGSGHHSIVTIEPGTPGVGASLSGAGSHLLYSTNAPFFDTRRVAWDGGPEAVIPLVGGAYPGRIPSNATASVVAGWDFQAESVGTGHVSRALWFEDPPILTSYGFGTPGTSITWDVGGEPGDPYISIYSLLPAANPFKNFGILGVDPSSFQILTSGVVSGAQNVGQVTVGIPVGLVVPFEVDIYFQALVLGATGALSNTAAFTITPSAIPSTTSGGSLVRSNLTWGYVPEISTPPTHGRTTNFRELIETAQWRDPAFWMTEARAGRTPSRPYQR